MEPLLHRLRDQVRSTDVVPQTAAVVSEAEAQLGFPLHPLLRAVYLAVGDHGFGPGLGFLPLQPKDPRDPSVVGLYLGFNRPDPENPRWVWPARLVPFCDWGCAMYSCLDCSVDEGPVFTFEYVPDAPVSASLAPTRPTFADYLADWLDGKTVFEPVYVDAPERSRRTINPFTRQPVVLMGRKPRFWP